MELNQNYSEFIIIAMKHYNDWRMLRLASEMAFVHECGAVPVDALFVASFERLSNNQIDFYFYEETPTND